MLIQGKEVNVKLLEKKKVHIRFLYEFYEDYFFCEGIADLIQVCENDEFSYPGVEISDIVGLKTEIEEGWAKENVIESTFIRPKELLFIEGVENSGSMERS